MFICDRQTDKITDRYVSDYNKSQAVFFGSRATHYTFESFNLTSNLANKRTKNTPRAGHETSAGRIWPTDRTLPTPVVNECLRFLYCLKKLPLLLPMQILLHSFVLFKRGLNLMMLYYLTYRKIKNKDLREIEVAYC